MALTTVAENMQISSILVKELLADAEFNCRGHIAPIDVSDLARSMDRQGLQLPIEVKPLDPEKVRITGKRFQIICGHRRHKAAEILQWERIPAIIKEHITDVEARVRNLTENLNRKDLNILQEAFALRNLKEEGMTQDDVSKELDKSRGWVQVRYMLLDLTEEIQEKAAAGLLSQQQIRDLYMLRHDLPAQAEAVRSIIDAKSRGEKVNVKPKKPPKSITAKKPREKNEVFEMIDHINKAVGMNFGTRCLAWAAGEISDLELFHDIKGLANERGKYYEIPTQSMEEMAPQGGFGNQEFE